jgi:hypothetical protein
LRRGWWLLWSIWEVRARDILDGNAIEALMWLSGGFTEISGVVLRVIRRNSENS